MRRRALLVSLLYPVIACGEGDGARAAASATTGLVLAASAPVDPAFEGCTA